MTTYPPTAEQQAAIDLFLTGRSLCIEAGAGTGKTSTLQFLAAATSRRGQYIAFNKAIVAEARLKFPSTVNCSTAHSLAYRSVASDGFSERQRQGKRMRSVDIANRLGIGPIKVKTWDEETKMLSSTFLAGLTMRAVTRFCQTADPEPTYRHVPRVKGLDGAGKEGGSANRTVAKHLEGAVKRAWADLSTPEGGLPFTTNTAMAVYLKLWQMSRPVIGADYLLFDEAQDANPTMAAVVALQADPEFRAGHGMKPAQIVYVGDSCQPRGTLVTVVDRLGRGKISTTTRQIPIEQIEVGDRVVSYNIASAHVHLRGSIVTGVSSRSYRDDLVMVTTESGLTSRYTKDHRVIVRTGSALDGKHVVYLMRRGHQYRVGRCMWRYGSQGNVSGPYLRCRNEKADAFWILSSHDALSSAALEEARVAYTFSIPTLTFEPSRHAIDTRAFWDHVGSNRGPAERCLTVHGRLIDHPLWSTESGNLLQKRALVTRAANLMDGMSVLPLEAAAESGKQVSKRSWEPIIVGCEAYDGEVYSMTVEGDHTYVGDGIITHNCQAIYGFTGAVNAMAEHGGDRAFLTQSFRFGHAVADVANHVLGLIPGAELRLKGFEKINSTVGSVGDPDVILCRTNATAVRSVLEAQKAEKRVHLVGGGQDIVSFAKAAASLMGGIKVDHPELACFDTWGEVQQYVEEDEQGGDLKLLVALIDEFTVPTILAALDGQVNERDADLVVSTAHKAKGREWGSVQIAGDFPEDRLARGGDEATDELRLLYVAVTRAQVELDVDAIPFLRDSYVPRPADPVERAEQKPRVARAPKPEPKHVGTIGETLQFEAGCVFSKGMTTKFGYTHLTSLVDRDGNVFKAFLDEELKSGSIYEVRGKVKAHEEYQGVPETRLTFVSTWEAAAPAAVPAVEDLTNGDVLTQHLATFRKGLAS